MITIQHIKKLAEYLTVVAILVIVFGTIYVVGQQSLRQSANDPQIQLAEDLSRMIIQGQPVASGESVDISQSLDPFMIVFDENGKLLNSSASLNGQNPVPPSGVFDYAKKHGQDRFTWQPAKGVRSAVVMNYFNGNGHTGFVLVGRSLREIEVRGDNLFWISFTAGLLSLLLVTAYSFFRK